MKNKLIIILLSIYSSIFCNECPPSDTTAINPIQNLWSIPELNNWDEIEIMTWNVKQFPISNNTINYVSEIITDLLPDIIAFQEINNNTALNILNNNIPAYEFTSSGTGLVIATRLDIIEIESWSTLFPSEGYNFAWRYPLSVNLKWLCGSRSINLQIINIHLKSGSSNDDFSRRYNSCQLLSNYIDESQNTNTIILGDYNDEITDPENINSLWPLVSHNSIKFATESIANIDYYASYPSWPSFIDHIALSTELDNELNIGNINTIRLDDYTGYTFFQNYISDHRPVVWSFPIEEIEFIEGLVINEIMRNPSTVSDAAGEWIEITNISDQNINLNGLIMRDDGDEEHIIYDDNLILEPNKFLLLGINDNINENGGISIDYKYSNFTLSNLWDEIIIEHPNGIILDQVQYDNGIFFPNEEGKSMLLINPLIDNNLGENWTTIDFTYGNGDYGTPGYENNFSECGNGDLNADGGLNVLDVIFLVNCILLSNCSNCSGDINIDYNYNILDIVALTNCILAGICN